MSVTTRSRLAAAAALLVVCAAAVVVGAWPSAGPLIALAALLAALAARRISLVVSVFLAVSGALALLGSVLVVAARPEVVALVVPAAVLTALVVANRVALAQLARGAVGRAASVFVALASRGFSLVARVFPAALGAFALVGSALVAAVWPEVVALVVPATVLCALAIAHRKSIAGRARRATGRARSAVQPAREAASARGITARRAAALGLLVVGSILVAAWPATALLLAVVAGALAVAFRSPLLGLAVALLLFGAEGTIKALLRAEPTPLPFGGKAIGAAAIDLVLLGALASIVWRHRPTGLRELWQRAGRAERAVLAVVLSWLALSVLQMLQGGDPARGASGFRLFQFYVVISAAVVVVLWAQRPTDRFVRALLLVGLAVASYATLRVVIGPSGPEYEHALGEETVISYGGSIREFGSFSSAVGLSSYLTPLALFALVVGFFGRSYRRLGLAVGALSLFALLASYGRTPLVGLALGGVTAAVVLLSRDRAHLPRVAGAVLGLTAVVAAGIALAATAASSEVADRARGLFDPFDDPSVELRLQTWEDAVDRAMDKPLGEGIGAVGSASGADRTELVTTDNSFLKVLVEQGVLGAALFCVGVLCLVAILARRLRRRAGPSLAIGAAALGAFVSFLAMSASGEYVEQPGKVIAWAMLGLALVEGFGPERAE